MTAPSDLPTLYKNKKIYLWVEDDATWGITTKPEAEKVIFESAWWSNVLPNIGSSVTVHWVREKLEAHHEAYSAMLANDQWLRRFSGKEVLRDIVTRVWTKKHSPRLHADFIKSVGRAQRSSNRVPEEIKELRSVLRNRSGLPT